MSSQIESSEYEDAAEISVVKVGPTTKTEQDQPTRRRSSRNSSINAKERITVTKQVMSGKYDFDNKGRLIMETPKTQRIKTPKKVAEIPKIDRKLEKRTRSDSSGKSVATVIRKSPKLRKNNSRGNDTSVGSANASKEVLGADKISKLGCSPKKHADVNNTSIATRKQPQRRSNKHLDAETASTDTAKELSDVGQASTVTAKRSRGRPSMKHLDKTSSTPIPSYSQILQMEKKEAVEKVTEETPKRRKARSAGQADPKPKTNFDAANKKETKLVEGWVDWIEARVDYLEKLVSTVAIDTAQTVYADVNDDLQQISTLKDASLQRQLAPGVFLEQYQKEVQQWQRQSHPPCPVRQHDLMELSVRPSGQKRLHRSAHNLDQSGMSKYLDPANITLEPEAASEETLDLNVVTANQVGSGHAALPPEYEEMEYGSKIGFWLDRCDEDDK
ncbi:unnamed protein product, partial [Mesorhabditis belari]|uniref:Uncharacterized protein n=1 Tax=Mesorhabditis belari TaxID=2138241 RepID=A0AAF3EQK7_9BILA